MNSTHHYEQLIEIFNSCFADEFNTRLIKGDDEPIYLPADAEVPYNRLAIDHDRPFTRFFEEVNAAQKGTFPRSRRSDDAYYISGIRLQ